MPKLDASVVKIGGSLFHTPELHHWLAVLARRGGGKVVVVPGGGPFADLVRDATTRWRVPDAVAHGMAIHAMEQFGLLMAGLRPELCPADTEDALHRALRQSRVPVWMPYRMAIKTADVPASWDVTSDTLAAWLALRVGARRLSLVKSVRLHVDEISASALSECGVTDPAFAGFVARLPCPVFICDRFQYSQFPAVIEDRGTVGIRVVLTPSFAPA